MRGSILLLAALSACAGPSVDETPDDPAALVELLGNPHPLRREEAVHRLTILGRTVQETLRDSEKTLARLEEDTLSVGAGLAAALDERSPERMVWRAWHVLRTGCLARDGNRVADALARQGLRLVEIYEPHERAKFVRYLARAGAYVNGAGDRHDLFFWIQSARREDGSWIVREAYAGLHVAFDAPFKQVAALDRYPRGSVLAQFLELPEIQKLAVVFPLLEEIELTYGRIRERDSESVPAGFHVNAGFALAGEGKNGGRGITCAAESELDPRETRLGKLAWEGHSPSDTRGPLTVRGNSFWGAGGLKPADD